MYVRSGRSSGGTRGDEETILRGRIPRKRKRGSLRVVVRFMLSRAWYRGTAGARELWILYAAREQQLVNAPRLVAVEYGIE